jgi:hypothetical protein
MLGAKTDRPAALPEDFLAWQVELRHHTMEKRFGRPHAGVAPVLTVKAPGIGLGHSSHAIICGLLPAPAQLETKTREFRELYEAHADRGARAVYDIGIEYLKTYYREPGDFDASAITTLMSSDSSVVRALRAEPRCSLLFYVFDLEDRSRIGRFRCTQLCCRAEIFASGPVHDNVWWHNALFHGPVSDQVAVVFRHLASFDTGFGELRRLT